MGKVYEAMRKSERERGGGGATALGIAPAVEAPRTETISREDEFDFIRYSLGAAKANEIDQMRREMDAEQRARQLESRPAREVSLDPYRMDPHLVVFNESEPQAADEFGKLAGAMMAAKADRELKRLLIASASKGDGRTSVSLNLACTLARAGQRVLVVDADFRRPSVLRLLGVETDMGIAEAVSQKASPGAAALKIQPHGFVILPARGPVDSPSELLVSHAFRDMLAALDGDYDFILFDSSPLLDSNDSGLLQRLTNATLLVVRAGETNSSDLGKAIGPLVQDKLFGVILNRVC